MRILLIEDDLSTLNFINKGLKELTEKGVDKVIVLPMYPHYAMSSYETVVAKVESVDRNNRIWVLLEYAGKMKKLKFDNLGSMNYSKV